MTDRGHPTPSREYYLGLVKILPTVDVDDPRVQAIIAAQQLGDKDAEKLARKEFDRFGNNFHLIFRSLRQRRSHRKEVPGEDPWLIKADRLGETWTTFVSRNQLLITKIDVELGFQEHWEEVREYRRQLAFDSNTPLDKRWKNLASLDAAVNHPLGVSAIGYAANDRINPLLREAWTAMEVAGIDPKEFAI